MNLRARTLVAGLALAGLALAAFAISSRAVDQRLDQERESRALEVATALTRALAAVDGDVRGVVGLFSTSRDVDGFSLFAAPALRTPGLVSLAWAPRVTADERAQFEQSNGFALTQLGADGSLAPADTRPDHYPVAFAAPLPQSLRLVGLDLGSASAGRYAIAAASASGVGARSGLLPLLAEGESFVVVEPAYARGEPTGTPAERAAALTGFSVGVVRPDLLIADALDGFRGLDAVQVVDSGEEVYRSGGPIGGGAVRLGVPFAGSSWQLAVVAAVPGGEMALPWVVLAAGLALALLVATLLEHLSRRRVWAERLVEARTAELAASLAETKDANEALAVARSEAERRSRVDALTGAYNRQHLLVELGAELNRAVRAVNEPGLVLLEIDGFQHLNEEHGLAVGDAVLVETARRLRTSLRSYDCIARWRGDQFALLVADVPDDPTLWKIADTVRQVVSLGRIPVDGLDLWATVCVGAARATETLRHPDALVDAADAALRAARKAGPDRTVVHANGAGAQPEPEAIRIAEALAVSAAVREGMPEQHCHQVARLAGLVAEELGQPEEAVLRARVAGWLHDLGKVSIPDRILAKPDALDEEDWRVMRTHPALGEEIVLRIPALVPAAAAIRHHHERWDGAGYPDGLAGESIPLDARIVAAADVYVSMTSEPPFRRARDHRAAIAELRASAGSQLDPRVVEALVTVLERERRGRAPANVEGEVDA